MPKKSVAPRGGTQRQKPRAQKSFELVRPEVEGRDDEEQVERVETVGAVPVAPSAVAETFAPIPQVSKQPVRTAKSASTTTVVSERVVETKGESTGVEASKASASTRMAARRQATQRTQQRSSATLITPEHFAYVRRELLIIAILAILMFTAIVILYFTFGRGA
ncbi:MAG: hypothetical protein H0U76_28825 [Ktedonobacteraceae bacterium]|nr:hypothetical protein [Ktedonobacteraceae bacterium]